MTWGKGRAGELSGRIRAMTETADYKDRSAADDVMVVLCTCPDASLAARLAAGLVEQGLAACVNILPAIRSIYAWRGEVRDEAEALMIVKTTRRAYPGVEAWLAEHHPYEVPEVLALPVSQGLAAYLDWLVHATGRFEGG